MAQELMLLFVNDNNYMSAIPLKAFEEQWKDKKPVNIKGSKIAQIFMVHKNSQLFFFTDKGKAYSMDSREIIGNYSAVCQQNHCFIEILQWQKLMITVSKEGEGQDTLTEKIISVVSNNDLINSNTLQLFLVTEKGMCKRLEAKLLNNTYKLGKTVIQLRAGDQLKQVHQVKEKTEIILISAEGKAVRFNSSDVRSMGRQAMGVRGINVKLSRAEGIESQLAFATTNLEGDKLLIIGDRGYGKILELPQIPLGRRGNKRGMICHKLSTGGWILYASCVNKNDHLIGWTHRNYLYRLDVRKIPQASNRYSRGDQVLQENKRLYDSLIGVVKYIS